MIEKDFDIAFIADLALREKQIQQNYRPIIAVHKWFARRPGTLFRGLILSEFARAPLQESFYRSYQFPDIRIADPFMGGGTPLLEANRVGCNVLGFDINPMSYWIVKQEIEHLDLGLYVKSAYALRRELEEEIGHLYRTRCILCGTEDAQVKYFLWVKFIRCRQCRKEIDLFPGYLLAADSRHPKNVFVCPTCGELTESEDRKNPGTCSHCHEPLSVVGPAGRNRCKCPKCGADNSFPSSQSGPLRHRLFAIEYFCASCKGKQVGRLFKTPDSRDQGRIKEAEQRWEKTRARYVPEDEIPSGDETNRLHRWGYKQYRQMFNLRQLLGLELSARIVARTPDERTRNALATNLSDLLRYQNMLCRYDTVALKSLDIFSVHGFPVGLIQCESNFLGIKDPDRDTCIGSGGWANIIDKFHKAKSYCDAPFEVKHRGGRKEIVPIKGEWIGDRYSGKADEQRRAVDIQCRDATAVEIPPASLDAVFTDPPYFGNIQYAELMDFCYVWLRRLVGGNTGAFKRSSTRHSQELTGNEDMGRGIGHFAGGLSSVFERMANALKPGAPLVFTYHHNDLKAYYPIAVAILNAGLTCSASLPCPAEMGASIHISGTGSSIIDTVFVCRLTGTVSGRWLVDSPEGVANLVREDVAKLKAAHVKVTPGDTRCIAHGHLVRLAIWSLRKSWNKDADITRRLAKVAEWLLDFGGWRLVERSLGDLSDCYQDAPLFTAREHTAKYGVEYADVSF